MTTHVSSAAGDRRAASRSAPAGYAAGRCNIGPAEISRRRRLGHAGALTTTAALATMLLLRAPSWAGLLLFFPAAGAAAGFLQAALRFCADYGWRGVFNFGRAGHERTTAVIDERARKADRRRALYVGGASAAIGALVAVLAVVALGT